MNDAKFSYQIGAEFAADLIDRLATPEVNVADAIADTLCAFAIVAKEYRRDVARGLAVGLADVMAPSKKRECCCPCCAKAH